MKIAYIASAQIPSTRANSIQVMKVCQALKQNGEEPRLYVPGRTRQPWESLSRQYGLQTEFEIHWVPAWRPLRYVDFVLRALLSAKKLEGGSGIHPDASGGTHGGEAGVSSHP